MNLAHFFKHDFSKGNFRLYDKKGNETFYETSNKYWARYEYDENGNETFYEDSDNFWIRYEYDENGNKTFSEYSNGYIFGTPKSKEIEMTVKELQDLISKQEGKNVKLKIKE